MSIPLKPNGSIFQNKNIEASLLKEKLKDIFCNYKNIKDTAIDKELKEILGELHELLHSLSSDSLETAIAYLHKNNFTKQLISMFKHKLHDDDNDDIIIILLKIYVSILSIKDLEILNEIASDNLIVVYERLLDSKNSKLLELIFIGLANLVSNNSYYKTHYKDTGLLSKLSQVFNYWIIHDQVSDTLLYGYCKLMCQYFITHPLDTYTECKYYVEFFIKFYISFHRSLYVDCEEDILNFLTLSLSLADEKQIDDLSGIEEWSKFLYRMIDNLLDDKKEINLNSIKILVNLTYSNSDEIFRDLLKVPTYENCEKLLRVADNNCCKDLLIFLANLFVFGGVYIDKLCKNENLIYLLLEKVHDNNTYNELKEELLSLFRNLFTYSDNNTLSDYLYRNYDLIQIFIEKIHSKETGEILKFLYQIIRELFEIGNYIKARNDVDHNVFVEYIANEEKLAHRLEEVQHHEENRIVNLYVDLIRKYLLTEES